MMKKIRELLKEKRWKWTAGGVACLVAASMGFSTMQDIGVRADEISLGTETVDLERVSGEDHTYWIETAEQLRKIGNATEGTANLTFKLKNDMHKCKYQAQDPPDHQILINPMHEYANQPGKDIEHNASDRSAAAARLMSGDPDDAGN
jgi:hypothetical protein